LEDYLIFARDLQLDSEGAMLDKLMPFLPQAANGGFGRVETSYDVRFGSSAIAALLKVKRLSPDGQARIRSAMRAMVLSNYLKGDSMHDVAFAYATPAVFALFRELGFAVFTNVSRVLQVAPVLAVPAPKTVVLDRMELNVLTTLYNIENDMLDAIAALIKTLNADATLTPEAFEKKLGKFGAALANFDKFDQASGSSSVGTTTIFAMFDMLIRLATGGSSESIAVLRLKSTANGKDVEKLFMTRAAMTAQ
jgi:endonuclease/exonuclease/phosphatase (EEP) superfamily protein YafD